MGRPGESQVQLLLFAWETGEEYISHQQICLLCSAPEKGTWLDLTYGINIINS